LECLDRKSTSHTCSRWCCFRIWLWFIKTGRRSSDSESAELHTLAQRLFCWFTVTIWGNTEEEHHW